MMRKASTQDAAQQVDAGAPPTSHAATARTTRNGNAAASSSTSGAAPRDPRTPTTNDTTPSTSPITPSSATASSATLIAGTTPRSQRAALLPTDIASVARRVSIDRIATSAQQYVADVEALPAWLLSLGVNLLASSQVTEDIAPEAMEDIAQRVLIKRAPPRSDDDFRLVEDDHTVPMRGRRTMLPS